MELVKGGRPEEPPKSSHSALSSSTLTDGIFIYSIPISFGLGLQYLVGVLLALLYNPLKIFPWLCLLPDDPECGELTSKILFLSGFSTIMQSLFGSRSPVMIAPSAMFLTVAIENFKTSYWVQNSNSDLYAMGPEVRHGNLIQRTGELQGLLVASSLFSSATFVLFWYFKIKLPSATVSSTLVSMSILNIVQLLPDIHNFSNHRSSLTFLSFCLLLFFFIIQDIKIPCLKVITSEDHKIRLRIFKVLGVIIAFIICVIINVNLKLDFEKFFERIAEPHSWLSYNFLPLEFNKPTFSFRSWLLFPTYISQILASYCCYSVMNNNQGSHYTAIIFECVINICTPLLGLFIPLAIDPVSFGLWCLSEVKNSETTIISGSFLVVLSAFLQILSLCSYVPYTLIYGISAYSYGHIISKVLSERKDNATVDLQITIISVFSGMMISYLIPNVSKESVYDMLLVFVKSPVLLTFFISFLLRIPLQTSEKNYDL